MNWLWRLICRWRGHDARLWKPVHSLLLRPGQIIELPTPKLVEYLPPPPPIRPDVLAVLPLAMQQRYAIRQAFPMICVNRHYCARCGEAWS